MKVKIVYRNYKPLHKIYESLVQFPPTGITYEVPPVQGRLAKFFPVYKKLRYLPLGKHAVKAAEKLFFSRITSGSIDLLQYVNMIAASIPDKPYIVDIEHAASLVSFTPDQARIQQVKRFLLHEHCKAIDCMSNAARRTLNEMMGDDYALLKDKVHIVYPSLTPVPESWKPDYSYIKQSASLKLLLVGNQAYLKGVEEALEAVQFINKEYSESKIELHIISNDAQTAVSQYNLPNVYLHEPSFSKEEIFRKFYMPADIFLMPTKQDTFGMAVLDALSCGTAAVVTKQFALPELVDDGVDGMLIKVDNPMMDRVLIPKKQDTLATTEPNLNKRTAKEIATILAKFLDGKLDAKKMGIAGKQKFKNGGKFSVTTRNAELEKIYRDAIK